MPHSVHSDCHDYQSVSSRCTGIRRNSPGGPSSPRVSRPQSVNASLKTKSASQTCPNKYPLRSSLRPEISWHSKRLSVWDWRNTTTQGLDAWLCMEAVRHRISYEASSPFVILQLTGQCYHSRLRPRRNNLVQIPPAENQSQEPQYHHRRPRPNRSMRLRLNKPLRVFK